LVVIKRAKLRKIEIEVEVERLPNTETGGRLRLRQRLAGSDIQVKATNKGTVAPDPARLRYSLE
jgi:hypothetical protein